MWPTENTAFLVIHGAGPQRDYETLDKFARNFYNYEKVQHPEVEREHMLDASARSCVRFKRPGYPYIDFYEYYWDRFMVRSITGKEMRDWLREIYEGIDKLEDKLKTKARNYAPPLGLIPFTYSINRFLLKRLPSDLFDRVLGYDQIKEFFQDPAIYCLHNQRSGYYDIREKVLSGAVDELTGLLKSRENYGQIIVVGHCLGSVIAYDALNRIARDVSNPAQNLKGLVTFSSFLDVDAFFYREHVPSENEVEQEITVARHAFKKPEAMYPGNPIDYKLLNENVKWLNFYLRGDIVGDKPLLCYGLAEDDQIEIYKEWSKDLMRPHSWYYPLLYKIPKLKRFVKSFDLHYSYWGNHEMYSKIALQFFKDLSSSLSKKAAIKS